MAKLRNERAMLVLVTVVWGLNFVSSRVGLGALTPLGFRLVTFGVGALILGAIAAVMRRSIALPRRIDYVHLAVAGVLSIAMFGALISYALLSNSAGRTSIIVYTMPIWVAVLGRVFLGERLGVRRGGAVVLALIGLGVLLAPVFTGELSVGTLAALGAAVSWAIGTVYLKWAGVDAPPIAITLCQLCAGTVVLLGAVLLAGDRVVVDSPSSLAWLGVAYTTVFGVVVAYLLWFQVVQQLPATVAGLGTLLVPVFGTVFGVLLIGERPTLSDGAGFVIVLAAGVLALSGGGQAPPRRRPVGSESPRLG